MTKKSATLFLLFIMAFPVIGRSRGFRIFTIMLDPAGDARETGRIIEDSLERAITIEFAQKLQEEIESYLPNSKVIITRSPGELVRPLQNANFANRLPVDLYLSINCVHAPKNKPTLYVYQFSLGDTFVTKSYNLAMTPYDKAHQHNAAQTTEYGKKIVNTLSEKDYVRLFKTEGAYQLPFAPLIGIQAPALGLEISVPSKTEWKQFVQPLAFSIATALE